MQFNAIKEVTIKILGNISPLALYFALSMIVFGVMMVRSFDNVILNPDTAFLWWSVKNDPDYLLGALGGLSTAFYNIHHGLTWLHHLVVIEKTGLGLSGMAVATNFLFCLSLGIAAFISELFFGRVAGLLTFFFCFQFVKWITFHTNASVVWFPAIMVFVSLAAAVYHRRGIFWVILSVAFSMATQFHFASIVMLPSLGLVYLLFPPGKPFRTLLVSLYLFVLSWTVMSWDILYRNIAWIFDRNFAGSGCNLIEGRSFDDKTILVSAVVITFAIVVLAWNFRGSPWKNSIAGIVILAGGSLITLIASYAITGFYPSDFFDGRNASVMCGLIIVSAGGAITLLRMLQDEIFRFLPIIKTHISLISFVCCALITWKIIEGPLKWAEGQKTFLSFSDAEAVAKALPGFGVESFKEASIRLRTEEQNAYNLLSALSTMMPAGKEYTYGGNEDLFLIGEFADLLCECVENGCLKSEPLEKAGLKLIRAPQFFEMNEITVRWKEPGSGEERTFAVRPDDIEYLPGPAHPRLAAFRSFTDQTITFDYGIHIKTELPLLIVLLRHPSEGTSMFRIKNLSVSNSEVMRPLFANSFIIEGGQYGKKGVVSLEIRRDIWKEAWLPQIAALPLKEKCVRELIWFSENFSVSSREKCSKELFGVETEEKVSENRSSRPGSAQRCEPMEIHSGDLFLLTEKLPLFELLSRILYLMSMVFLFGSVVYVLRAVERMNISGKP